MDKQTLFQGDIYRYSSPSHCKHGLAIVRSDGTLHDTYWGGFSLDYVSGSIFVDQAINTAASPENFLGNIKDFGKSHREVCAQYPEKDCIYLPIGGGSEQWYIRNGAVRDLTRTIQQKQWEMDEALSKAARNSEKALQLSRELRGLRLELEEKSSSPSATEEVSRG